MIHNDCTDILNNIDFSIDDYSNGFEMTRTSFVCDQNLDCLINDDVSKMYFLSYGRKVNLQ